MPELREYVRQRLALCELEAHPAVAGQITRASEYQIACACEAHESFGAAAQRYAETRNLG
jgi:hypothetical protein